MNILGKLALALTLVLAVAITATAQCENWNNSAQKEEAENAHVVYRPYLKGKTEADVQALNDEDFGIAFDNWMKAYSIAPAADGQRPTHYIDGILLYKAMIAKTEDTDKKTEYAAKVMELYDQHMECYPNDKNFILGRKAFDMFYSYGYGYTLETLEMIKTAIDVNGNDTEYILLDPLGKLLVYLYESEQIDKATVQQMYNKAVDFAEHNIESGHAYKEYYESGKANMDADIDKIASEVFDCAYFKKSLLPAYEDNKDNWDVVSYVWTKMIDQGCEETDPDLAALKGSYDMLYAALQDSLEKVRRMEDPCFDGIKLQEEKRYSEALSRYKECLDANDDPEVRAQVLYSMAFIQTWELGQYGSALRNAREAASLKSGWGKPYLLIGDTYAKMSRSCDDWNQRLAIIAVMDKYSYAKSIDSSVADDANRRLSSYRDALPARQDGFMRNISAGQSVTVSCIGETVKVRFKD